MQLLSRGSKFTHFRYQFALVSLLFFLSNLGAFSRNVSDPSLWFDESGQYWMSKGQLHQYDKFTEKLSLLEANVAGNLDPGGFTLILHYWTSIFGSSPTIMRLLSFSFFAMFAISFIYMALKFLTTKVTKVGAILGIFAISEFTNIQYYAYEIRAYSFSYGMLSLSICLTFLSLDKISWKSYVSLVGLYVIACSGRYSTIPFIVLLFLIISFQMLKQYSFSRNAFFVVISSSITFSSFLGIVYFAITKKQNSGNPPVYVQDFLFKFTTEEQFFEILRGNLLEFPGLLRLTVVGVILLVLATPRLGSRFIPYRSFLTLNSLFLLGTIISEFLLSQFGLLPWYLGSRWSIEDWILILYSLLILLFLVERAVAPGFRKSTFDTLAASLLLITLFIGYHHNFLSVRDLLNRPDQRTDQRDPVGETLVGLPRDSQQNRIFVDTGLYPDVRYLIEASGLYDESWVSRARLSSFSILDLDKGIQDAIQDLGPDSQLIFLIQTTNSQAREDFVLALSKYASIESSDEVRRDNPAKGVMPASSWAIYIAKPNK